ncbi:MAG: MoxR family ATPase, partial [Pseudomonadota bacterium]
LDRFLVQIDVPYPSREAEREIVLATTGVDDADVSQVFDAASLIAAQTMLRRMPVGDGVLNAILDLVRAARPGEADTPAFVTEAVSWGPGPRAAQALMMTVRARALLQDRLAPSLEDVEAMAAPVLKHRMALSFAARAAGNTIDNVIAQLVSETMRTEAAA